MKIYVAGSRHERESVNAAQRALIDRGHTITFDWTSAEGEIRNSWAEGYEGGDQWSKIARREVEAVREADCLVACLSPEGLGRGLFIEIGIGIERGIPIYLLGDVRPNDSNFWCLDQVTIFRDPWLLYDKIGYAKHGEADLQRMSERAAVESGRWPCWYGPSRSRSIGPYYKKGWDI